MALVAFRGVLDGTEKTSEAYSPSLMSQDNQNINLIPPRTGVAGTGMHPMGPPPVGHGTGSPHGFGIQEDSFAPRMANSFAPRQRQLTFPGKGMPDSDTPSMILRVCAIKMHSRTILTVVAQRGQGQRSKSDPYANGSGGATTLPMNSQPSFRGNSAVRGRPR
jgi:hypothetical protein